MRKLSLVPKETKFFALFQQQSENIVKMAQQLKDMINVWQNIKERASVLADMEQDGDAIAHNVMTLLHLTYNTPLDREDISALTHSLDDIADSIHAVADRLYLYGIESPTDRARELSDIILKAVLEVEGGISEITTHISKPELLKRSVTINQIENYGDAVYRAALVEIFDKPDDLSLVVKWREIYKLMESTTDECEDIADILEGIALKYD
jgi:uncharacterized protein